MPRRIFGHKREELRGDWRKLRIELNLYSSPTSVRVMKSMGMKLTRDLAHMGGEKCVQSFNWNT
jgi:hypothetical protein